MFLSTSGLTKLIVFIKLQEKARGICEPSVRSLSLSMGTWPQVPKVRGRDLGQINSPEMRTVGMWFSLSPVGNPSTRYKLVNLYKIARKTQNTPEKFVFAGLPFRLLGQVGFPCFRNVVKLSAKYQVILTQSVDIYDRSYISKGDINNCLQPLKIHDCLIGVWSVSKVWNRDR